jgi:hypothetical protein
MNEYRSYVSTYTSGGAAAAAFMDACAAGAAVDGRWRCFERLMMSISPAILANPRPQSR